MLCIHRLSTAAIVIIISTSSSLQSVQAYRGFRWSVCCSPLGPSWLGSSSASPPGCPRALWAAAASPLQTKTQINKSKSVLLCGFNSFGEATKGQLWCVYLAEISFNVFWLPMDKQVCLTWVWPWFDLPPCWRYLSLCSCMKIKICYFFYFNLKSVLTLSFRF